MTFRFLATVLAATAVAACGKQQNAIEGPPQTSPPEIQAKKGVQGKWQSPCAEGHNQTLTGTASLGLTQRSTIEVAEGNLVEVTSISSLTCDGNDIEVTAVGDVSLSPTADSDTGTMEVSVSTYRVKPITPIGVSILNISKWCGITDWAVGAERDVKEQLGKKQCFVSRKLSTTFAVQTDSLSLVGKPDSSTPADQNSNITLRFTRL